MQLMPGVDDSSWVPTAGYSQQLVEQEGFPRSVRANDDYRSHRAVDAFQELQSLLCHLQVRCAGHWIDQSVPVTTGTRQMMRHGKPECVTGDWTARASY